MKQAQNFYARWHVLEVFFESHRAWTDLCIALSLPAQIPQQEYEDLLYGTNAQIYLPLWASVCKHPGAALMDETTRDVVAFYKKAGYLPTDMDGNPPDYIGQMCRFLEYLEVCALNGRDTRPQIQAFITEFFADTVHAMVRAADGCAISSGFAWILEQLEQGIRHEPWIYGVQGALVPSSLCLRFPLIRPEKPLRPVSVTAGENAK